MFSSFRCVVDPDTSIISQGSHQTRFLFNAFEFPTNHDAVYVSCNATFCETTDLSQRCSQTCTHRRDNVDTMVPIARRQGRMIGKNTIQAMCNHKWGTLYLANFQINIQNINATSE